MDSRQRRVIAARHRDRDWEAEVARLYDLDPLFMSLSLLSEGYGEMTPFLLPRPEGRPERSPADLRREEYDSNERRCREVLSILVEARPEAGRAVTEAWEAWWAGIRARE